MFLIDIEVCYSLGIYLLNLFLAFLTPKFDPSLEQELADQDSEEGNSGGLPVKQDDEFRPFIRRYSTLLDLAYDRLPEFKFWHSATRATAIAFVCTWFSFFDVPYFLPPPRLMQCLLSHSRVILLYSLCHYHETTNSTYD